MRVSLDTYCPGDLAALAPEGIDITPWLEGRPPGVAWTAYDRDADGAVLAVIGFYEQGEGARCWASVRQGLGVGVWAQLWRFVLATIKAYPVRPLFACAGSPAERRCLERAGFAQAPCGQYVRRH